jgi:two-component system, OmpR family, sensor kinase
MQERLSRWWDAISLRNKVTGVTVLLLATGLAIVGGGTFSVVSSYLTGRADDELQEVNNTLSGTLELTGSNTFSDDPRDSLNPYYLAAVRYDGTLLADNVIEADQGIAPVTTSLTLLYISDHEGSFTLVSEDGTARWRVIAIPLRVNYQGEPATLVIGLDLSQNTNLLNRYLAIFLFFAIAVVVFGGALTRLLVTSTFAPLRDVEATAARFAAGDFSQRMDSSTPNTEVGRLNRSLNTMLNRIDRAFADRARTIEQMRRFVGDASHELRTPLVSVRGYAELYRMGALADQEAVAQAMERIEKEAIRMSSLVTDLLELARIDEAKPLKLTPVDLVALARDAALDAMAAAPDRVVTVLAIEPDRAASAPSGSPAHASASPAHAPAAAQGPTVSVPPAGPPATTGPNRAVAITTGAIEFAGAALARLRLIRSRPAKAPLPIEIALHQPALASTAIVSAEENKIRQVITNLMGNAMRFTPDGSPIELAVEVDGVKNRAILSVIDHGEGIPPQIREKIFQRFWRADSSRNRDTGGSGLGLAIVASIVAAHKGEIAVTETRKGGATFRIALPLLQPGQEPAQSTPPS